ncbi:hypothetical protein U9M48_038165, partial [Paspalum notatum var. saurae]
RGIHFVFRDLHYHLPRHRIAQILGLQLIETFLHEEEWRTTGCRLAEPPPGRALDGGAASTHDEIRQPFGPSGDRRSGQARLDVRKRADLDQFPSLPSLKYVAGLESNSVFLAVAPLPPSIAPILLPPNGSRPPPSTGYERDVGLSSNPRVRKPPTSAPPVLVVICSAHPLRHLAAPRRRAAPRPPSSTPRLPAAPGRLHGSPQPRLAASPARRLLAAAQPCSPAVRPPSPRAARRSPARRLGAQDLGVAARPLSRPPAPPAAARRDTMEMRSDERFAVLRSIAEECIYEDELRQVLKKKPDPTCYVWFEPSPMMDIEQGILKTIYVNKMVTAGCTVKILMADWFLQRHPTIGNNLNKIRAIGCYNIVMWKAAGMYLDRIEIVWLSDELNRHAVNYWTLAMDVSRNYTMQRMASYCEYLSPYGPERLPAAAIVYPCMQVAAVLCQKADIWLFGMDQRDIIMLARDYCEYINSGNKPTILLHRILPNFLEDPDYEDVRYPGRIIFMLDEEVVVNKKISMAFCPPKVTVCNPCLEYIKLIVLPWFGSFEVVQKEGNESNKSYLSIEELANDYESGDLDSTDLKLAFQKAINNIFNIDNQITADVQKIRMQNKEIWNVGLTSAASPVSGARIPSAPLTQGPHALSLRSSTPRQLTELSSDEEARLLELCQLSYRSSTRGICRAGRDHGRGTPHGCCSARRRKLDVAEVRSG